jgi:ATP-dependent protease ClpP protease subunit
MAQWKAPLHKYRNDDTEGSITEIRIADRDSSPTNITGNHLYFYGDITIDSVLSWNKQLDDVSRNMKVVQTMYDLVNPPPIHIYIQSGGGEVFASLSVLGKIESLKKTGNEIHTIVEGFCASGATLISVGGSKRFIRNHSCMMVHQISSNFWGTYQQFQDEQKNVDLMMNLITEVYDKYTKFNSKDLNDILNHDLYLSTDKCMEKGLVDQVL